METKNKIRMFVYGTLRQGLGLSHLLKSASYQGSGFVYGTMYDLGSFPGIKLDESNKTKKVIGEVYFIDRETMARLDYVEGYNPNAPEYSLYVRKPVIVLNSNHEEQFGYIYEYNQYIDNAATIESGDWMEEQIRKESFALRFLSRT